MLSSTGIICKVLSQDFERLNWTTYVSGKTVTLWRLSATWQPNRTCLAKTSLWCLEIKKCSTSRRMSDYILCGHILGSFCLHKYHSLWGFSVYWWHLAVFHYTAEHTHLLDLEKKKKKQTSNSHWTACTGVMIRSKRKVFYGHKASFPPTFHQLKL